MAVLNILAYPNKILRKMSQPVKDFTPAIGDMVRDMFETMYLHDGIGLAAPQFGELVRLFVMDVPIIDPVDPEKSTPDPMVLVNPEMREKSGLIQYEEGCLSCPELVVKVDRSSMVRVAYLDIDGKKCELEALGLKAVCIQHEIDHLNGILLVDKLGRLERDVYKGKRIHTAKNEKNLAAIL